MQAIKKLQQILKDNITGRQDHGIYSVCCTNKAVLKAALLFAKSKAYPLVIESTSNQVDQFGGYTGLRPADFVAYVNALADDIGYPKEQLILGGDHLGPNAWQGENSEAAMAKAKVLVGEYLQAGYRKIHLDASMPCRDDVPSAQGTLADEIVAQRAAELCLTAEQTWQEYGPAREAPVYVIGTEVPAPGGTKENYDELQATNTQEAQLSYELTKAAFAKNGLASVWDRIIAMVVQPGVEFSDDRIFYYQNKEAQELSRLAPQLNIAFEAHSTDYQKASGLRQLVQDHYAILKLGPRLTYAYREALFALSIIEQNLSRYAATSSNGHNFIEAVAGYLKENSQYWKNYYRGSEKEIAYKCLFSLSDRIRYYWPHSFMREQVSSLLRRLDEKSAGKELPYSLVSQYFPQAIQNLAPGEWTGENLISQHISAVLKDYDYAIRASRKDLI